MSELARPTAILLDWDGTINDSMALINAGHNAMLSHFKLPPVTLNETRAFTVHEARTAIGLIVGESRADEGLGVYRAFVRQRNTDYLRRNDDGTYQGLIEGALALLDAAAAQNIPLGIVSNKNGEMLRQDIARLGWTARFRAVLGANEAAENKPSGEPALEALRRMGVPASKDVWFIGDTGGDMACAAAAKLTGIYVSHEPPQPGWTFDAVATFESLVTTL